MDVYSYELLAYRELVNPAAMPYAEDEVTRLPDYFITADDITPAQHVDIQAAAQRWIDSSISKTANVPTDFPFERFKDIYLYASDSGLKVDVILRHISMAITFEIQMIYQPARIDTGSLIDQVNYVAYMSDQHKYMFDEENLVNTLKKVEFSSVLLRSFDGSIDIKDREYGSIYAVAVK